MDLPSTATRTDPAPANWVPVDACTLPTAQQPLRVAEFDDLFATALRRVERSPGTTRARLLMAGDDGLRERVQHLADAETECCSFFTFTVAALPGDADGTTVALDIEVAAAHADVLGALVARAERTRGASA